MAPGWSTARKDWSQTANACEPFVSSLFLEYPASRRCGNDACTSASIGTVGSTLLGTSGTVPEAQIERSSGNQMPSASPPGIQDHLSYALCTLGLAASISTWFVAVRAPLWLDETIS